MPNTTKVVQLYEDQTKEIELYPKTVANACFLEDGSSVETACQDVVKYGNSQNTALSSSIDANSLNGKTKTDILYEAEQAATSLVSRATTVRLLYGSSTTWTTSTIILNDDYTNYDLICFIYSNSGEHANAAQSSSYIDSKIYPSDFLYMIQNGTGAIALFGYSTRYAKYVITNSRTFTWIRNGDSGTIGVIAIYGIILK